MRSAVRLSVVVGAMLGAISAGIGDAQAAETFQIDGVHSSLLFRVKHLNISYFHGRFNKISGTLTWDDGDAANNALTVEVKTSSVDTGDSKRDKHLESPDFFNAKQFPVTKFTSSSFKKTSDTEYEVVGELELHGVKKEITVTLVKTGAGPGPGGAQRVGFETVFEIKRSDFGMSFMLDGLSDDVRITVALECVQQQ